MKVATCSVSQVENYKSCNRKWFLGSVDYLPQEPKRATAIGDCLHNVLERYLDVDESGRKDGVEPNLYPEGWHQQKDFFGKKVLFELDQQEQSIIKVLVKKAIDEGIVIRRPNSITEYKEKVLLFPELTLQVRIDYAYDWTIEDHKSCKNFRYTLVADPKHQRYIGNDSQLLLYAYFWCKKKELEGHTVPDTLTVRHNQFCVGPETPRIEVVETQVTFERCEEEYKKIVVTASEQLDLRQKSFKGEVKWSDVPMDIDACSAYGGCPYKKICACQETPSTYKARVNKILRDIEVKVNNKQEEILSRFNIKSGATSSQEAVLEEIDAPAVVTSLASVEQEQKDLLEKFSEMMTVDEITNTKKFKELQALKESLMEQEAKAKAEQEAKVKADEARMKADKDRHDAELKAKAEVKKEVKVEEVAVTEERSEVDFSIKKATKSRSKELVVCINCYPIGGPVVDTITIQEFFALKSAEMAHVSGVASYFDLDTFNRRDMFYRKATELAKELEGFHLIVACSGPDETALLNAIISTGPRLFGSK